MPWWMPFARNRGGVAPAPPRPSRSDEGSSNLQPWQRQAWGYYQSLGEIHYGCGFYARMLSGVRLYAEQRDAKGEWVETTNTVAVEQLERLENSRGGMSALQGQYGKLRFVQGEAMLACTLEPLDENDPLTGYTELWEMLSAAELSYNKPEKVYTRRSRAGSGAADKFPQTDPDDPQPGTMFAYRFYHRDPEYSGMPDSSMRAVLEDCEELLLLKRAIRNTARNRGAGNGIVVFPQSMGGAEVDTGDGKMIPKNARAIYQALTEPIANEQASHAVTPVIVYAPPGVTSSEIFHLDLRGAALYRETGLRDECIRRIAIGLDMPPEALLGTSGVNHWTAWQIDESAWKNHGDPVVRELVEELTSAILAPVLEAAGVDSRDFRVWYDATDVVEDPDRGRAAQEAHGMLVISDAAARRDMGFQEEDAPDDAEWEKRAQIQKKPSTSTVGKSEPAQGQASLERVIGMAEACVLRCRELAGSKLRTKMQANGTPANLRIRIQGAHNTDVACRLGADVRGDVDADSLVAGAGQAFLTGMARLGLEPSLAETLVRRVEEHAARTLFDDEPGELPEEIIAIAALTTMKAG